MIKQMRQLFFSPKTYGQWCLAKNVIAHEHKEAKAGKKKIMPSILAVEEGTTHKRMKLHKNVKSVLGTTGNASAAAMPKGQAKKITALRDLLVSDMMYENVHVYSCLSAGLESGHMRSLNPSEPQRLEESISGPAEAFMRLELWHSLSCFDFSHNQGHEWQDHRSDTWANMCETVYNDRKKNGDSAWRARLAFMAEVHTDGPTSDAEFETQEPDHAPVIDDKYL